MAASCISLPGSVAQGLGGDAGFAQLDELAQRPTSGFQLVHVAGARMGTLARHLERRAEGASRQVVCVDAVAVEDAWRETAWRLDVEAGDPVLVAQRIVRELGDGVLIVCAHRVTRWGTRVAEAIAAQMNHLASLDRPSGAWIVAMSPTQELALRQAAGGVVPIDVASEVTSDVAERFFEALYRDERRSGRMRDDPLARIEDAFWHSRTASSAASPSTAASPSKELLNSDVNLSPAARRAVGRLAVVGRSVSLELQCALGIAERKTELLESGLVATDRKGRLWLRRRWPHAHNASDGRAVADVLARQEDPWDQIAAAELLVTAGELPRATDLAERALRSASATAREDLWSRVMSALDATDGPAETLLRLSAVALDLGDGDVALRLARDASARCDEDFAALFALGRATAARGDFTAAESLLERALALVEEGAERLRATVELADVLCSAGQPERARTLAAEAALPTGPASVRLAARNVLGKLLLAERKWDAAEQSFAADANQAAVVDDREAELRARLNQATALIAAGRYTEARSGLEALMRRAEEADVPRARAFALSNLAVLASHRHDYARALSLREDAIDAFRRIGNRKWLARSTIYLADLRLELGLVAEADQALAFARQVLGAVVPPTQAAWMSRVMSRIHLERGEVGRAAAEIDAALCSAARSNDGTMLADCHCLAARIAIVDGDMARAHDAIDAARRIEGGASRATEIALVSAELARAERHPFIAAAHEALQLARAGRDRARMAEAHMLLHVAARDDGDDERAAIALESARKLHTAIGATLPPTLRARHSERMERRRSAMCGHGPNTSAVNRSPSPPKSTRSSHGIVGSHPAMLSMFTLLEKMARTDTTVLVYGESGTGKELVANALVRQSPRTGGPLVKVNCAALVETLLMSELFGHEKGAFTGATSQRRGCFETADGGTVFLDEIGDISPATQAALLRVLQDRTFHRVGGTEPVRADVRIICATHRDLKAMVEAGAFREDLYYRLSGMVLEVPALRERLDDLPLLASEILLRMSRENEIPLKRIHPDAMGLLLRHTWPGNVRELENVLRSATLFAEGDVVTVDDLRRHAPSLRALSVPSSDGGSTPSDGVARAVAGSSADGAQVAAVPEDAVYAAVRGGEGLRELQKRLEHECIVRALGETGGHVTRAAALLGIKRPRLSQLIKQHNLRADEGDSK